MKRLMLLALIFCLPALAFSQERQSAPQNPARNPDFLRAQELESKGDVGQAIKLYQMLNQLDPNDLYFWKLVGLYEQTGDWQSMATLTQESLKRQPDYLEARRFLSRALQNLGRTDEAKKVLMGVLDTRKLDSEMVDFISSELLEQKDYPGALAMFQRGRQALGDSLAYASEIAQVYQFQEDYFSALKEYVRILDKDSSVYMRCSQLISHVQEQGVQPDSIAALFVNYLAKHPDSMPAARLASNVYVQAGKYENAFNVLRGPAIKTGNFADVWSLAEKIRAEGLSELAVKVYDDYYKSFPDVPSRYQALMAAGAILEKSGKNDEAKRRYQSIISDYAGKSQAATASLRLIDLSREETSFETYTRMLSDFAGTSQYQESAFAAFVMLGDAYLLKGMPAEANTAFTSARLKARSATERYDIGIKLAYQAFYTGQPSQMDDQITQVIAISPGGADVNDLLALKIMDLRCAGKGDSIQFADYAKARYALYRGEPDEAIRLFTVLGADTTSVFSPEAALELGGLYRARNMNRDASDWYLRAATATSDSTMKVGAMMAAAEIAEMTGAGRAEAKKLYMDALTKYSGTVYDNELRKRLQAVLNP